MITLEDFKVQSFEQKCDVVTTRSTYLFTRMVADNKVYLYHADRFFIEVFYSPLKKKVTMINAFNNREGLEPYVEMISLGDLA
jgi:hypothetical protein